MHKPEELIDVAKQVQAHLARLDLHEMIAMPDVHGKPMGVKVRIRDGLVQSQTMDTPWPLILLMAREQPWRGHGHDHADVGAVHLLAPWFLQTDLAHMRWSAGHPKRFQQAAIGDALASALAYGAVEPIPEQELVDDLADQVRDAASEVSVQYESWGPEPRRQAATSMLRVEVSSGDVTIIEWQNFEAATGERADEGEVTRQEARIELVELMDRGVRHRGTSGSDDKTVGIVDVLVGGEGPPRVRDHNRERMIVTAALGYLGYYGGDETWVDELGDD